VLGVFVLGLNFLRLKVKGVEKFNPTLSAAQTATRSLVVHKNYIFASDFLRLPHEQKISQL